MSLEGDPVSATLEMAEEPRVSRLEVSDISSGAARVEGALVFEGLESFSLWRESELERFLQPIGGEAVSDTTLRIFRPELVAKGAQPNSGSPLGDVSISYRNSENDST